MKTKIITNTLSRIRILSLPDNFPRLSTQPRALIPSVTARPAPACVSSESALYTCPASTERSSEEKKEKSELIKEPVECLTAHGIKYNNNILDINRRDSA